MLTFEVSEDLVLKFEDILAFVLLFNLEGDIFLELLVVGFVDVT